MIPGTSCAKHGEAEAEEVATAWATHNPKQIARSGQLVSIMFCLRSSHYSVCLFIWLYNIVAAGKVRQGEAGRWH